MKRYQIEFEYREGRGWYVVYDKSVGGPRGLAIALFWDEKDIPREFHDTVL